MLKNRLLGREGTHRLVCQQVSTDYFLGKFVIKGSKNKVHSGEEDVENETGTEKDIFKN